MLNYKQGDGFRVSGGGGIYSRISLSITAIQEKRTNKKIYIVLINQI